MYPFLNLGAVRGWVNSATIRPLFPRYTLNRRQVGPLGRSGRVRKMSPPSESSELPHRLTYSVLNRPIVSGTRHIFESPKSSEARVCHISTAVISSTYQVAQGHFPTVLALQDKWRDLKAGMWQYEQRGTPLLANVMRGIDLVCPWKVSSSTLCLPWKWSRLLETFHTT